MNTLFLLSALMRAVGVITQRARAGKAGDKIIAVLTTETIYRSHRRARGIKGDRQVAENRE